MLQQIHHVSTPHDEVGGEVPTCATSEHIYPKTIAVLQKNKMPPEMM